MNSTAIHSVDQYRKLDVQTSVASASSHQLIEMLFDGIKDRLNQALGCLEHEDYEGKGHALSSAVEILVGLQASLDHEKGGELAGNLEALYDYMQRRLFRASCDNDASAITEVSDLIDTLRSAWKVIGDQE